MYRVKMTFFCRKISPVDRRGPQDPGAPRFIQVEPRQGHGSSRRLHGSPRFSGRFSTVHPCPCRQNPGDATVLPGSPRRSYGPSRFTTVQTGEVKILIYNSVLKRQHAILKNGARTPRTVTKFAVKTAIDLTKVI